MLRLLSRIRNTISSDRRPEREKQRERESVEAVNSLKTLRTTSFGGMAIDPEEIRDHVIPSREGQNHMDHKPGAAQQSTNGPSGQVFQEGGGISTNALGCIAVAAWRWLPSVSAVSGNGSVRFGKCRVFHRSCRGLFCLVRRQCEPTCCSFHTAFRAPLA